MIHLSVDRKQKKLRLRIIPVTVTWVFAAIFFVGSFFNAYQSWQRFPIKYPEDSDYRMACYLSIVKAPCSLIAAILLGFAGKQWLRGRWWDALVCYGIVGALFAILIIRLGIK